MKKKFNKNIIVFGFFIVFLISGMCGNFFDELVSNTAMAIDELKSGHYKKSLDTFKNIDTISSENLSFHDYLMDLNSVKDNLVNTRIVEKDSSTTIKSKTDSLIMSTNSFNKKYEQSDLTNVSNRIRKLKEHSEKVGADFCYVAAPEKGYYEVAPENINNYCKYNYDYFMKSLEANQINTINLANDFKTKHLNPEELFFVTDAHWKPLSGFMANNSICEYLSKNNILDCDRKKADINNYQINTYSKWFLGNIGKRVGTFFTWKGADDFDLITPKFNTSFEEIKPYENSIKSGSFEETLLYMDRVNTKDYYGNDPYTCYCGGNHRLQIIKNNLNKEGKKILLIKDSFAFVVAPFLSTQVSELHIADTREELVSIYDKKVNWYDYIEEIKPDVVIVLYKGVPDRIMLDFEGNIIEEYAN